MGRVSGLHGGWFRCLDAAPQQSLKTRARRLSYPGDWPDAGVDCGGGVVERSALLGEALGLSAKAFGVWAGLSIHQTPQVIAAGFAYSQDAGSTATIVKLARVCLLAPVVFVVGWLHARGEAKGNGGTARKNISYRSEEH